MEGRNFRELLTTRQQRINSLVCVGLDPLMGKIPEVILKNFQGPLALFVWMIQIIDATAPFASMFKPQHAHWEKIPGGLGVLRMLIAYIHSRYPEIPVFMDCKRGDIDRTQEQYRDTHLVMEAADGMNYNGYMGRDTLKALIDPKHLGRALVGLGRTSNPDAWEIQDTVLHDRLYFWEFMVERILVWSTELGVVENAGVVMGAAHKDPNDDTKIYSEHLVLARKIVGDQMWFLIPGIGTQRGFVEETVVSAFAGPGSIAINSSSGITNASSGEDFAEAAAREAEKLRDQIRAAGGNCSPSMGDEIV